MRFAWDAIAPLFVVVMSVSSAGVSAPAQRFAADVDAALRAPEGVVFYSLEPWEREEGTGLHSYKILGKLQPDRAASAAVIAQFRRAVESPPPAAAACFDPRHALQLTSKGHTYDFLLCYDCGSMRVLKDGKFIEGFGASGSPVVLNKILGAARIALSTSGHSH